MSTKITIHDELINDLDLFDCLTKLSVSRWLQYDQ